MSCNVDRKVWLFSSILFMRKIIYYLLEICCKIVEFVEIFKFFYDKSSGKRELLSHIIRVIVKSRLSTDVECRRRKVKSKHQSIFQFYMPLCGIGVWWMIIMTVRTGVDARIIYLVSKSHFAILVYPVKYEYQQINSPSIILIDNKVVFPVFVHELVPKVDLYVVFND